MANSDYSQGPIAHFTPIAELAEAADYLDRTLYLGRANFPRTDSLKIGMAVLCDDEFMAITALGPGTVAVKRGVGDTVPARHPVDSLTWFIDNTTVGSDRKEYGAGTTTEVKYSPYTTGGGAYPINEGDAVTFNWRFFRPYPPGQMRVNGERWYEDGFLITADQPTLTLTWDHRDRILEQDQLVDHDAGNIGPEPGTTYTIRIYGNGDLKRTEVGVMTQTHTSRGDLIPPSWTYTWAQAMQDFGFDAPTEEGSLVDGAITVYSTRDGFDSWQGYMILFKVDPSGKFLRVAQLGQLAMQNFGVDPDEPILTGVYAAQIGQLVMQPPGDDVEDLPTAGVYVGQLAENTAQDTSFYGTLERNLFEMPYALLAKLNWSREQTTLVTVVARPSDRLTDSHSIWTRYDWPAGTGAMFNYQQVIAPSPFTPWITLEAALYYLDTVAIVRRSSFFDGVSLVDVKPGSVAMVGAEIVRVESVTETQITLARGCFDTVPARHAANSRMWFFGTAAGDDPTNYPLKLNGTVLGAAAQVKMVPDVFGPPLELINVPTDRVEMNLRVQRPYAPGQVMIGNKRWYEGGQYVEGQSMFLTWVHRNRVAQDALTVDHLAPGWSPEDNQTYRLKISIWLYPKDNPPYEVIVRKVEVDGTAFEYTWEMIQADGYRAGSLLGVCGRVTVGFVLEAVRFDLTSWQNYVIPVLLPANKCSPGQAPGGGQLPGDNGGGNGDTGGSDPGSGTPGGDNSGDGPGDPVDNGGSGDNGTGPPKPPTVPPDWPDPIDPQPPVDPEDPNPELAAHWDTNWDRHWDAYKKDNQGG